MTDAVPDEPAEPNEPAVVVNHVGLCTTDLERATRFYGELLGFVVERDLELPDDVIVPFLQVEAPANLHARYLRCGDAVLELLFYDRPGDGGGAAPLHHVDDAGLTHVSFSVDDVDATTDRVEALGGTIVNRTPMGVLVRDPDGQLLELLPMSYHRRLRG